MAPCRPFVATRTRSPHYGDAITDDRLTRLAAAAPDVGGPNPDDVPDAVPAATVVLGRDGPDGLEILMVRRDSRLAFAGGMWVFPGGRVDPTDHTDADAPDAPTGADETDPGPTVGPPVPRDPALRRAEGRAAAREALEEAGLAVDPATLVRLSHWTPPARNQARRFSTAFFVAPAPDGAVSIDDGEIRDHQWIHPRHALARHEAGEVELAPPTFITLSVLAEATTVDELLAVAARGPVEHFATRILIEGDRVVAAYHGDASYDDGTLVDDGPRHRLHLGPGPWRYERTAVDEHPTPGARP